MNMNTNNTKTGVYFYNDESHNFEFATTLSIKEKVVFVNTVANTVVDDNYNYLLRSIMFDFMIIKTFTDIDTSFLKIEDEYGNIITDIDLLERFLDETNIVDIVKANMEFSLFDSLNDAVDKAIEFRTGIHPSPIADALASLLSTLERKINEYDMGSMMGMAQKFAGMTDEFNLDNLVKAYMNSETHKNNLVEIEEAKRSNKGKKTKNDKKNEIEIDEDLGEAIRAVVKENKAENDRDNAKK